MYIRYGNQNKTKPILGCHRFIVSALEYLEQHIRYTVPHPHRVICESEKNPEGQNDPVQRATLSRNARLPILWSKLEISGSTPVKKTK